MRQRNFTGPRGDPSRHRPFEELAGAVAALPRAPRDKGRLVLIVARDADGNRDTPESVRLTPERGIPGDRWNRDRGRDGNAQLAVMRRDVAELIANGQPLTTFGDNLFVDLDITPGNLPTGTRIRVGTAVVEVTPKKHTGCSKFSTRFGGDALRVVNGRPGRAHNLRGIYWTCIEAGEVSVGDAVEVVSRPPG